ncbi:protease [Paenibacillus campinasensis]|uniref:Protease n=1 Tax=Paenibacillus campinasensis TaxID=66347 RepID=A0A268F4Z9_9BACL|nr:protease [Paenibacillus campinasensis]PAD80451.1 protease [Paenibacillus campinasensis]
MEALYWGCLFGGILFAVVSVLLGDVLSSAMDGVLDFLSFDFFNPMVIAGGITVFGGAGIMFTQYTNMAAGAHVTLSILSAIVVSILVYFGYVRPMENSENSTGFSEKELAGRIGTVTVPLPAEGFGEVMVRVGAGNTAHIASSFDRKILPAGARVVVIDVVEGVLRVSELEERKGDE